MVLLSSLLAGRLFLDDADGYVLPVLGHLPRRAQPAAQVGGEASQDDVAGDGRRSGQQDRHGRGAAGRRRRRRRVDVEVRPTAAAGGGDHRVEAKPTQTAHHHQHDRSTVSWTHLKPGSAVFLLLCLLPAPLSPAVSFTSSPPRHDVRKMYLPEKNGWGEVARAGVGSSSRLTARG